MRPNAAILAATLFWCSLALCQPQPLATVVAPDQVPEHTAARIVCDTTADDVRFEVFELLQLKDSRGRTVEVPGPPVAFLDFSRPEKRQYAFTGPPGRYLLRFDCVDYDDRTRELSTAIIEVVAGVTPPIPPDDGNDDDTVDPDLPDIPDDRFGNVGRAVANWLGEMPPRSKAKAKAVAKAYGDTSDDIRKGTAAGLDFNATITNRFNDATGMDDEAWTKWWESLGKHLDKPAYFQTKADVADAYESIFKALGGGQ